MKPKLLILTNNSDGLYGFRKELIIELNKKYEIVASTPDNGFLDLLEKIGCYVIVTDIDRRGINPITDLKLVWTYLKLLIREKPNMVMTYTIKPNVYGGTLCRFLRCPYVVNITGLGTAFQKSGMLRKLVVFMYKVGLKHAKAVFFENQENLNIFENEKIVRSEQTHLLNGAGVNLEHYHFLEYPEDNDTTKFLFIGRVMQEKGVNELFTAMKRLNKEGIQCTLDVLGGYEENYEEAMKRYEADGWLHYHGYQKDVRSFIEKAHCFVLPSWHEGMANTNLECAAMGRPVITSNIHGCKEAVAENVSGYLCAKQDADDLYEKMKKFAQLNYAQRKAMGMAGRAHMEAVFDKRKVVKATIEGLGIV